MIQQSYFWARSRENYNSNIYGHSCVYGSAIAKIWKQLKA